MKLYHGTFEAELDERTGVLDFCTTEDFDVAEIYATDHGDDGFVHEFKFSGSVLTESEMWEMTGDDTDAYVLLDSAAFRNRIAAAGYDAVEFADYDNMGNDITTIRVLNASALALTTTHNVEF